jgi:hypothetical protein
MNRIGLPRTGQTTSYYAGDDGTKQAGVRPFSTRVAEFINLGNGTIFDRATGLQWVKDTVRIIPGASVRADNQLQRACSNYATATAYLIGDLVADVATGLFYACVSSHTSNGANVAADLVHFPASWRQTIWPSVASTLNYYPATMSWTAAIDACTGLNYAGFTDWRLPNIVELVSLYIPPTVIPAVFGNVAGEFWTGTTTPNDTANAHTMYFASYLCPQVRAKTDTAHVCVLPVRNGRTL